MKLDAKQQKKLQKIVDLSEKGDLAIIDHIDELENKLDESISKIESVVDSRLNNIQEELKKKLEEELNYEIDKEEIRGEKGEKGEDGKDGVDGIDGTNGKDGKDGLNGKDGIDGINGLDGKDGSPDTGERIVEKINTLPTHEEIFKIKKEHISGLDKMIEQDTLDRAVSILDQRTSYLVQRVSNLADTIPPPTDLTGYVTGTGVSNRLAYWNGTSVVTSDSAFTVEPATGTFSATYITATSFTGTYAGTWQGTNISTARGGTGTNSWTQGDIPYYTSGTALSKLAKNTSATRYLSNTGTNNAPAWAQVDLTNGVTGVLPLANMTPAGSDTQVQFNDAGVLGADSNFIWDKTKDALAVQVTLPQTAFHVASVTGAGISNVTAGSASLVAETLPSAPTGTVTEIPAPTAGGTGGSVSYVNGGSGSAINANGTTYYFRIHPVLYIASLGAYYRRTDVYEEVSSIDPNDAQGYDVYVSWGTVTITGETVNYFVEYSTDGSSFSPLGVSVNTAETYTSLSGSDGTSAWPTFYISQSGPDAPSSFDSATQNPGGSGYYASGQTIQYEIDQYKTILGTKYASGSPATLAGGFTDDSSMTNYSVDLAWTTNGTFDGVFLRKSLDGGSSWTYIDVGSTSSYNDDSFGDDGSGSRWGQTFSGTTTYTFTPYGKGTSPSGNTIYSSAGSNYAVNVSSAYGSILKHTYSGLPAGGGKILAPAGSVTNGRTVTGTIYDVGYNTWVDGVTVTPTSYGYSGTNQNRAYRVYSFGSSIYGDTPLAVSTTQGSGTKYGSLSWTLPSGITAVRITRSINGGAYNFYKDVTGSSTTDDSTDTGWISNASPTITPTSIIPGTGRFDRAGNNSETATPVAQFVDTTGSGTRYVNIGFGVAADSSSAATFQSYLQSNSSTGHLSAVTARFSTKTSLGGSLTVTLGDQNEFNITQSSSTHFWVRSQNDSRLINTRSDWDTVGFGQAIGSDPSATVHIHPARSGDSALVLKGHTSHTTTSTILQGMNNSSAFTWEITMGGHWRGDVGSAAAPGHSFRSDNDTGAFNVTTNTYGISTGGTERVRINSTGMSIGTVANPTSKLTLAAGSATANTAPFQFTSGALETVARAGVMEFLTDRLTFVGTTGATRKDIHMMSYRAITSARTLDGSDELVNCTSGTFAVTLPTAVGFTREYTVYNSGSGTITINTTSSQTVSGSASGVRTLAQHKSFTFRSDGANWIITAAF